MAERALAAKTTEAKKENPASRMQMTEHSPSAGSPAERILFLQRTIGNQAVQRLMGSGALQAKLRIGAPGDVYEQEADRVAEQVMRTPEPQRECTTQCPIGEKKDIILRKTLSDTAGGSVPDSFIQNIGSWQPLDNATRAYFEPRFNTDLKDVRVHTNSLAAEVTDALNARAFTQGKHIVFGHGEYAPDSTIGSRLMAHELTHVLQQSNTTCDTPQIQRQEKQPKTSYRLGMRTVDEPDGKLEIEIVEPWKEGGGIESTVIGMAKVAGITEESLIKELVDSGAYKNENQVKYDFRVGTRIVIKEGRILEISVRGKVYKAGGKTKPDLNYFLEEGVKVLSQAGFGLAGGDAAGRDAADSYDASTWDEDIKLRGVIRAKVDPWSAIDRLVKSIGKDIPKAGGGRTRWQFDCFEFVPLLRLYAYWRTMTKSEFNRKFSPLELGYHSRTKIGWSEVIQAEKPGDLPFKYVGGGSGIVLINPTKVLINKSWEQLLKEAPVGSQIIWSNLDARNKCSSNSNLPFCNFVNENTLKLGPNRYAAHPFGALSEDGIKTKMAQAATGKAEAGYISKYIFISVIRYPK